MFIKTADKKDKNTGKVYRYYKLCESYRIGNKVRHKTILVLGRLDEIKGDPEKKALADCIEHCLRGEGQGLFPPQVPAHIEKLAKYFSARIQKECLDKNIESTKTKGNSDKNTDIQEVDLSSLELQDVREIGAEWLCKQVLEELGLGRFLKDKCGWGQSLVGTAMVHIISRASYPASEHKTAQWINDNSAVAELFNVQANSIDRFHLYHASRELYNEKAPIENFLSHKTNELFDLQDKVILYDLTNMYFEGRKAGSKIARFGRSKEKRNDARIVSLAMVVNVAGFVKYSHIYRGNIADCKTLEQTLGDLSTCTSTTGRKPIVVIDAGIATEDNLKLLKSKGYSYICVSRTKLKDYDVPSDQVVHLSDKRGNPIDICWAGAPKKGEDRYLYVHSQMKAAKEASMQDHFCHRYEEELDNVASAIHKKRGTKKYGKVMERIGRIKERYPAANKHYSIDIEEKDGIAIKINWKRKHIETPSGEGIYFIRTDLQSSDENIVWEVYNSVRQIESTFRVLKTDLSIRPVYHKKDENTIAHINLGILAYSVVNTIRCRLKNHGIDYDWQNIVRIMNTQKAGTISVKTAGDKTIYLRVCSKPTTGASEIYKAMGYKPMPFYRKKYVFPES